MQTLLTNAKTLFYNKRYEEAFELFLKEKHLYGAGLCKLLLKDPKRAKKIWSSEKSPCLATSWGLIVLDLIKLKAVKSPTYLQVRAFYETYMNLFINSNLIEYAENLLSLYPFLFRSNFEVLKFTARVLWANRYYDLSLEFIDMIKEKNMFDPEALFIEAQIYLERREYSRALNAIDKILAQVPEYYPAVKFKNDYGKLN